MSRNPLGTAFLCVVLFALSFALYTNRVWEDYYITFRSSKNLATGHGLVFNHGDRLHTFTSPLGVLLPAGASAVTGNKSDMAALWVFRVMCMAALGGAAALLVGLSRRLAYPALAAVFLTALLCTDVKSLDFTINGMETAFMLLFLAYALWAHLSPGPRQWLHLGGAWAGLMWTRPDSFIYIGLLATGCWIFNQPERTGGGRGQQLGLFIKAGLLTTALYGPWIAWAWWYYGTPVPHTIVAKGAQSGDTEALKRFLHGVWQLPWLIWKGGSSAEGSFLPVYYMMPAWPAWMMPFGRILAIITSLLWLVPKVRLPVRVTSFAYYFAVCYLSFVPYFAFPWYFPPTTLLAFVALSGVFAQLWQADPRWGRALAGTGALVILAGAVALGWGAARQARAQQFYVEDGNRRVIGEWLKANAEPGDTVFMEPLGYIGYFSGLKTYDWPGMSAREVPEACRMVGNSWANVIRYLEPTWLVMRAQGEGDLPRIAPAMATLSYDRVREFSRKFEIDQLTVPGLRLLQFDSQFVVYHRRTRMRQDEGGFQIASPIGSSISAIDNIRVRLVHAPGTLIMRLKPEARWLGIRYGFPDAAAQGEHATNGAIFQIWLVDGRKRTRLHEHKLEPQLRDEDRGLKTVGLELPARQHPDDAYLDFETDPMGSTSKDWTFWSDPDVRPSPPP